MSHLSKDIGRVSFQHVGQLRNLHIRHGGDVPMIPQQIAKPVARFQRLSVLLQDSILRFFALFEVFYAVFTVENKHVLDGLEEIESVCLRGAETIPRWWSFSTKIGAAAVYIVPATLLLIVLAEPRHLMGHCARGCRRRIQISSVETYA